ncbi:hypothetical protein [Xenorhabdus bovienii]|nr:hypothetical protein [Xenorhabdus bovienii]
MLRFGLPEQHFSQTAVKNDRQFIVDIQIRRTARDNLRIQPG